MSPVVDDLGSVVSPSRPGVLRHSGRERLLPWLQGSALLLAIAFSMSVAVALGQRGGERQAVFQVALLAAIGLCLLACTSFETFVLGLLVLRPALDWPKSVGLDPSGLLTAGAAGLFVVAGLLWLAAQGRAGTRRPLGLVSKALLVLLAVLALATVLSLDPVTSVQSLVRTATGVMVFVVVEQLIRTREQVRRAVLAVFASTVVPLLVGLHQLATGEATLSGGGGRLTGTFVHPNSYGFYLVLVIAVGVAVYRHLPRGQRAILAALLAVSSVQLVLTYSRGGWVTLGVALLLIGVLQVRKLLVLMPVGTVAVLALVPGVSDRLADLEQSQSALGTPGNSLLWRFSHWEDTLALVGDRVLTGVGPGLSDVLVDLPPHNDSVRLYTEAGLLGLGAYALVIVSLLLVTRRALRSAPEGLARGLCIGVLAAMVAFVLDSQAANLISQVVILTYVFALAAVGQAAGRLGARPDPDPIHEEPPHAWPAPHTTAPSPVAQRS